MSDLEIIMKHKKFLEKARVNSKKDYYKNKEARNEKNIRNYYKRKNKVWM